MENHKPQINLEVKSFYEASININIVVKSYQHRFAKALGMPSLQLPLYDEEETKNGSIDFLPEPL